jgi:hypothetical protein
VLTTMRVTREQDNSGSGGEDEEQPDQGFLDFRPASLAICQRGRRGQGGDSRRKLAAEAAPILFKMRQSGDDDAERRHLRHGKIDEDDAAPEHGDAPVARGSPAPPARRRRAPPAGRDQRRQRSRHKPLSRRCTVVSNSAVRSAASGGADREWQHHDRHLRLPREPLRGSRRVVGGTDHHARTACRRLVAHQGPGGPARARRRAWAPARPPRAGPASRRGRPRPCAGKPRPRPSKAPPALPSV